MVWFAVFLAGVFLPIFGFSLFLMFRGLWRQVGRDREVRGLERFGKHGGRATYVLCFLAVIAVGVLMEILGIFHLAPFFIIIFCCVYAAIKATGIWAAGERGDVRENQAEFGRQIKSRHVERTLRSWDAWDSSSDRDK